MTIRIAEINDIADCDHVAADEIEECRKQLGCTPAELADHLGWSTRKYQRVIDAAKEEGDTPRDVVLSLFGLSKLLNTSAVGKTDRKAPAGGKSLFFGKGADYTDVIDKECADQLNQGHKWTAEVTPHILRELAICAQQSLRITYNDLAEKLETAKATKRVWPRTAYGRPLGSVCTILTELGRITRKRIPLLSVIVVKQDGRPGEGFDDMTKAFFSLHEADQYRALMARMRSEREGMIAELQKEVFDFPHWEEVLRVLGLNR